VRFFGAEITACCDKQRDRKFQFLTGETPQMKTSFKIAAAVATSLVGMSAAHATSMNISGGDGNLMFFVTDAAKGVTYTDVLTQDVNSLFTAAQATTPAPTNGSLNTINGDAGFSVPLGGDTTLTNFITAAGSDQLTYGVIAGAYTGALGSKQRATGSARYIASSANLTSVLETAQTSIVNPIASGLSSDIQTLNLNLGAANSTNQGVFGTSTSANGPALNLYQSGLDMSGVLVGQSVALYGVTGNGTSSGFANAYSLGTLTFANDTLTFAGNTASTVPLPAAVWLLGSGLLGLLGVSRRRSAEAV
jgi:hypothetical protein